MRQLSVTREKSVVASLGKMKFYIEDPVNGDTDINGVRTRMLLELKSGETGTAEIGDGALKLFAIAGLSSKDWCLDVYNIPEGTEDIAVSGKNHYNPTAGNPFRFNGNESDPAVREIRKKNSKRGILILVIAILIGLAVGFIVASRTTIIRSKTFKNKYFAITLDTSFKEEKDDRYDMVCVSDKRGAALAVSKSEFPAGSNIDLAEYCDYISEYEDFPDAKIQKDGSRYFFEYDYQNPDNKITYHYKVYIVRESGERIWLFQFSTLKSRAAGMDSNFKKWIDSVKFE